METGWGGWAPESGVHPRPRGGRAGRKRGLLGRAWARNCHPPPSCTSRGRGRLTRGQIPPHPPPTPGCQGSWMSSCQRPHPSGPQFPWGPRPASTEPRPRSTALQQRPPPLGPWGASRWPSLGPERVGSRPKVTQQARPPRPLPHGPRRPLPACVARLVPTGCSALTWCQCPPGRVPGPGLKGRESSGGAWVAPCPGSDGLQWPRHLLGIYCQGGEGLPGRGLKGPAAGRQPPGGKCVLWGRGRAGLWGARLQGGAQAHPVPTLRVPLIQEGQTRGPGRFPVEDLPPVEG